MLPITGLYQRGTYVQRNILNPLDKSARRNMRAASLQRAFLLTLRTGQWAITNMDPLLQPLDTELWFIEWAKLRHRRQQLDGGAPDAIIRKAFYLMQLAPVSLRPMLAPQTDEATLDAFLDCGAYESASLSLVPAAAALSLTRLASSSEFSCAISLGSEGTPASDSDRSPAKAVLGSLCAAISRLRALNRPSLALGDNNDENHGLTRH